MRDSPEHPNERSEICPAGLEQVRGNAMMRIDKRRWRNQAGQPARLAYGVLAGLGILLWALWVVGTAVAVRPTLWREDTQGAFAKGEADGVSLTRDGAVTLSPVLEEVADTGEQFVWSLARDGKGRLYAGTGNSGKVFGLGKGKPELLFDSPEVAIFSLAVGEDGALYAGSSPDGLIYRIVPGKEPVVFCRTGDDHVWALVADDAGGLCAATGGGKGRILRISSKGEARSVYESSDPNVVCLIRGADGSFFAGTDENGLVYRMDAGGKVRVLYDAPEKEIHALALGPNGVLYAGAMSGGTQPGRGKPGAPQAMKQGASKAKESSVVYAIRPSGAAYRLWEAPEPMLLALSVGADGEITVVTGDKGRVYRLRSDGAASVIRRMADVQPWAIWPAPNGDIWMGTAGAGKVFRLGEAYALEGTLTAEPRDFGLVSRWGKMAWKVDLPSGTSVVFQTRSGNSETPDDTWSAWSAPLAEPDGSQVLSPPGRFLQYRARLKSDRGNATPRLREITLTGLQENVQPLIHQLSVAPPGEQQGRPSGRGENAGTAENGGRRGPKPSKAVWGITWAAGDANEDRLSYALFFRGRGEKEWKLLEEDLTTPSYLWDTESAPEGTTQIRVVASDRLSNPASIALTSERTSEPFDIDHTPPVVRLSAVRQTGPGTAVVEGTVEDVTSPIREAAFAINSGSWEVLFPADEIFDSRAEALRFVVEDLGPGEYTVVVRAVDALGNVGVGRAVFEIK